MCYDDNAIPPLPPGSGGTAHGEDLMLSASDGNRFSAYIAHPGNPTGSQVLIYPDARGLHTFYKELALRFAEVGIKALALDYFGRTAGTGSRDDSFEFRTHVQQLQLPTFFQDVTAALAYLQTGSGSHQPTFTVGFCMGGSLSFATGTQSFDLAGVIGFYAGLNRKMAGAQATLIEQAPHIHYPLLGLFGGADQAIPVEDVHAFEASLKSAGAEHKVIIYPDAPHSFFDRRATDFANASTDAWQQVLSFITTHTPSLSA